MKRLVALLLFAVACFGGAQWPEGLNPEPGARNVRRVAAWGAFASFREFEQSPWGRAAEYLPSPVFVALDGSHYACVIDGPTYALVKAGDSLACDTPWRAPRRR